MTRCPTNLPYLRPCYSLQLPHFTLWDFNHTHLTLPSMATLTYSPDLESNVKKTLRRLSKYLLGSGIALQDSDLPQEFLNAHDIERHTDLSWRQVDDSERSSPFATPLDSDLIDAAFKAAVREEKPELPPHEFDLNGRFYTAFHLAYTLLEYSDDVNEELANSPWDRME